MASKEKSIQSVLRAYETGSIAPKALTPMDRLVFGILTDYATPLEAEEAMARLRERFINWNELRVARWIEIARGLDPIPDSDACAIRLRSMLGRLFELRGAMALDFLTEMKVTDARKLLVDLDSNLPRHELNLIMFEMIPGMSIPLSQEGLKVARKHGLIGRTGNKNQLQKTLETECEGAEAAQLLHYIEVEAHVDQTRGGASHTRSKSPSASGSRSRNAKGKKSTTAKTA